MKLKKVMSYFFIALSLIASLPTFAGVKVALSFDDAPMADSAIQTGNERTQKIIGALKNNGVEDALFFVKADNINAQTKNRLQQYTAAGYHLGNHSFSHLSANKISQNDFLVDVYRAHVALKEFDNVLPYFRPPYLHYGKDLTAVNALQLGLAELGYKDGFVTVDNADWYINSLLVKATEAGNKIDYKKARELYVGVIWDAILFYDAIAKKAIGRSVSHVLLLHENDTSALFLDALIKHIKQHGGEIISPQQAYADPAYVEFPQVALHNQGRIAAIAMSKGVAADQLKNKAETSEYLDALFLKHKVIK